MMEFAQMDSESRSALVNLLDGPSIVGSKGWEDEGVTGGNTGERGEAGGEQASKVNFRQCPKH